MNQTHEKDIAAQVVKNIPVFFWNMEAQYRVHKRNVSYYKPTCRSSYLNGSVLFQYEVVSISSMLSVNHFYVYFVMLSQ
jgi:hypothetical protein